MKQNDAKQLLSDTKFYESYSRWIDEKERYETWDESVERVMDMHREFYKDKMSGELADLIDEAEELYKKKYALGSQRALQFGGKQILKHNLKIYNCLTTYADRPEFFGHALYSLLCGCGLGFSVQEHHIAKLPKIAPRNKQAKTFVPDDSIEGWSDAISVLMASFFSNTDYLKEYSGRKIYFDLSKIREKGAKISGGFKAPGPEPLRRALDLIESILTRAIAEGRDFLKPIEVYDIVMHFSDAVLSGGVRRSAAICIFSVTDNEMMEAKTGNWYEQNPQRARSNNSALIVRSDAKKEDFQKILTATKERGDPGFYFAESTEHLPNPCVTGDTLVTVKVNNNIEDMRMDRLVEIIQSDSTATPEVLSYNIDSGEYEWDRITDGAMTRKDADVIELETETGEVVRCTPDHKILTNNRGWVEAKDLTTDDELISM